MDINGSICKHCSKRFHNCSSCGYDEAMGKGYCSIECVKKSKEYLSAKRNSQKLYDSLNEKQQWEFVKFIDDHDSFESFDLFSVEPIPPPIRIRHEGLLACQRFFNEGEEHICYLTKIEKFLGIK